MRVKRCDDGRTVDLGRNNWHLGGGMGDVYVDGEDCIKIYHDAKNVPPATQVRELAKIATPSIMAPRNFVEESGQRVGVIMRRASDCYPLPAIAPPAWRIEHGLDAKVALGLALSGRENYQVIHGAGCLVFDPNENNFLLPRDFGALVHIDVDGYSTPSHPASAIAPIVRDPRTASFDQDTDLYGFALLAFYLFIGSHPFKCRFPGYKGKFLDRILRQMKAGASMLRPEATPPPTCQPLSSIPSAWRDWFEVHFHSSERPSPPDGAGHWLAVTVQAATGNVVLTRVGPLATRHFLAEGVTGKGAAIQVAPSSAGHVEVRCNGKTERMRADEVSSIDGRIYLRAGQALLELRVAEIGSTVNFLKKRVAGVSTHSTRLYRGVAIQDLFNQKFAFVLPRSGRCVQVQLPQLADERVIDARFACRPDADYGETGILRIATEAGGEARIHTYAGLGRDGFGHHHEEVTSVASVEVVELDSGVAVIARPEGVALLRPSEPAKIKHVDSDRLAGAALAKDGTTLIAHLANGRYSVKLL